MKNFTNLTLSNISKMYPNFFNSSLEKKINKVFESRIDGGNKCYECVGTKKRISTRIDHTPQRLCLVLGRFATFPPYKKRIFQMTYHETVMLEGSKFTIFL